MQLLEATNKNQHTYKLVFFFPLFFILLPRPPIEGSQYLAYASIGFLAIIAGFIAIKNVELDKRLLKVLFFIYMYLLSISFSSLLNWDEVTINSLVHILKPILFALVLCAGYFVAANKDEGFIVKSLLKFAYFTLIIQVIIGCTQLFGVSVTGWLYSEEKTRGFGQIVRITGTLTNPNIFAWIVLQVSMIIYLFENKKSFKYISVIIGFMLVVFSGSRSLLLLFPFAFFLANMLKHRKTIGFFMLRIPLYVLFLFVAIFFVYLGVIKFGEYLPYVNELAKVFTSGDISEFNSYSSRLYIWSQALNDFDGSLISWLFGLGAASIRVVDNDYIYSLLNYGLVGTTFNLLVYFVIYVCFNTIDEIRLSVLGRQYILLSLIIGIQVETLSGWNYPILIMFYAGIAISLYSKKRVNYPSISKVTI